jgi:hypothetical protein
MFGSSALHIFWGVRPGDVASLTRRVVDVPNFAAGPSNRVARVGDAGARAGQGFDG